jgi:hypothetical protein
MSWWRNRLMPYDIYERHTVVSRLLSEQLDPTASDTRILDVGGRTDLLVRFTSYPVTTINVDGSADLPYDGQTIPFAENSFTAVINIDTLEHVPAEQRFRFVRECVRVARNLVIVAAPMGTPRHIEQERALDDLHRRVTGQPHVYLSEHIQYGLPTEDEIEELATKAQVRSFRLYYAGDFVWQAKHFAQTVRAQAGGSRSSLWWRTWQRLWGSAIFHPIRLRTRPYPTANRFYLLLQK